VSFWGQEFKVRLKATAFRGEKVTFFYDILGLT